jgi:hypothetical protein
LGGLIKLQEKIKGQKFSDVSADSI